MKMHRHLVISTLFLLTGVLQAGESTVVSASKHAVAVKRIISGLDRISYDQLWERSEELVKLGPDARGAMAAAMVKADARARLILGRQLMEEKVWRQEGAKALLALAAGANKAELRIYAANSLGQSTMLVGTQWILKRLTGAAESEKNQLVQVALHRARGRLGDDREAATALLVLMKKNQGLIRKEAALALGEIGRGSLAEVQEELRNIFRNDPTGRSERAVSIYRNTLARNPLIAEVLDRIRAYYDVEVKDLSKIDRKKLVQAAVRGMVASLDPFSGYMDPAERKQLEETLNGAYGGIGAYVNLVDGIFTIVSPIYGGPADRAGLRSLDRVMEVDGVKTSGEGMTKIISRLKGKPDTKVKVKIFRRGWRQGRIFEITRARINVDSVLFEMLPGQLGYVRIVRFARDTGTELQKAVADLKRSGAKGLILDLRDNPGGYLVSAVRTANEFLDEGKIIVTSKGRRVRPMTHKADGTGNSKEIQLIVLINTGSASASEILAGALHDNGRARLLGERSFGKGSVQEPIPLRALPGALLKLTIAKYYLPKGECIHGKGIKPDILVNSEGDMIPGWKYEEIGKVIRQIDSYALAAYKKNNKLCRKLAENDSGDPAGYPGLLELVVELKKKAHVDAKEVRPYVRKVFRRLAADDRGTRFVSNLEEDRQLQKAALELFAQLKKERPVSYDRYAKAIAAAERKAKALIEEAKANLPPVEKKDDGKKEKDLIVK
jgi:carboxyl-terminal processing protease